MLSLSRVLALGPSARRLAYSRGTKQASPLEALRQQTMMYQIITTSVAIFGVGLAMKPLWKIYCEREGLVTVMGSSAAALHPVAAPPPLKTQKELPTIEVLFTTHVDRKMPWAFVPQQKKIVVAPGESALVFYTARNFGDRPIVGMSLYQIVPPEAGVYFNKVQCFCFDEQCLMPGEEVDLPVLFFLDPEWLEDHRLKHTSQITLSYVFYESQRAEVPEEYAHMMVAQPTTKPVPPMGIPRPLAA